MFSCINIKSIIELCIKILKITLSENSSIMINHIYYQQTQRHKMLSIQDIVKSITVEPVADELKEQKVALVLDISGSTSSIFNNKTKQTVLEKEIECMTNYILENKQNKYELYSFESYCHEHGVVKILKDEDFVILPDFKSTGGTSTHVALDKICTNLNRFKPDIVKVYTDGQTNSQQSFFDNSMSIFQKNNIKFEIVAVTYSNINMETITKNEEMRIPGMELVNSLGNNIDALYIFNLVHETEPFCGISNTSVDKNSLKFLGFKINEIIPIFINKLLEKIELNKNNIQWGANQINLKKMLAELGKLLSIFFVELPKFHPLILKISNVIQNSTNFTPERIEKILEYGFSCSKHNKPIVLTNFEEHVKDSVNKHNEFRDAITELNSKGTTLGSKKRITIPYGNNPVCILDNGSVNLKSNLTSIGQDSSYPNSLDNFGNVYFGIDVNPQAIRIALRTHCGNIGFPGARYSTAVPFFVLCQMSVMFIKGVNMNSEHMKALRELAIYQTSLEVMVAKGKYDGKGCYNYWKTGKLIPMHYDKQTTHTSMYVDKLINPLGLTEPIWWALMMSMLGLFEEQKNIYVDAIQALGINPNIESFTNYIRNTYSNNVGGNIICETFQEVQKSLFTLDYFDNGKEIYFLKDHKSPNQNDSTGPNAQNNCCTKTWYSIDELEYVKNNGCVWCHYKPISTDFEKVVSKNIDVCIKNAVEQSSKITFNGIANNIVASEKSVTNVNANKFRINMCGITGSGKTTATEKMEKILLNNNYQVLIVNVDKLSKQGLKGKQLQNKIFNDIKNFDKTKNNKKVIIMDICNENGISANSFGWNFSEYIDLIYYPNFDKNNFDEYQAWCLKNVISRPLYTNDSNYWLNPVSAGLQTCLKVHALKASGVANLTNSTYKPIPSHNDINQLKQSLMPKWNNYQTYLLNIDADQEILNFLIDNKLVNQSANQSANQSTNQSANQSANQSNKSNNLKISI